MGPEVGRCGPALSRLEKEFTGCVQVHTDSCLFEHVTEEDSTLIWGRYLQVSTAFIVGSFMWGATIRNRGRIVVSAELTA